MSDALKKVSGNTQLPIFPLPLVMLPNEMLPLHIFEDRYRQMLSDVEHRRNFFGISFFEPADSFTDRPKLGSVGCVAEIKEAEVLSDGRSNILTLGLIRYRVLEYVESGDPYLVAEVDYFEDESEDADVLDPLADIVFALFERLAKAAFKMSGNRGHLPEITRTAPEQLSFLITAAFNFENEKKYHLLELTSTLDRLTDLKQVLEKAVGQLEESADIQVASRTNGHSKKKLDL